MTAPVPSPVQVWLGTIDGERVVLFPQSAFDAPPVPGVVVPEDVARVLTADVGHVTWREVEDALGVLRAALLHQSERKSTDG